MVGALRSDAGARRRSRRGLQAGAALCVFWQPEYFQVSGGTTVAMRLRHELQHGQPDAPVGQLRYADKRSVDRLGPSAEPGVLRFEGCFTASLAVGAFRRGESLPATAWRPDE